MEKLTELAEYFIRKIPAVFLVAILSVLGLILFLPEDYAKTVAVNGFRNEFRVYLGPAFLLVILVCLARIFIFLMQGYKQKKEVKEYQEMLHSLTPEEKGYLIPYIKNQKNTVYVGIDDGIMAGLVSKKLHTGLQV